MINQVMSMRFFYHILRRDFTNFSFLRHAQLDGFIVSMHQSGTHWLKHILACALTRDLGLPPPKYSYAGDIIGGAKRPIVYKGMPSFGHSHTIPSPIMEWKIIRKLYKFPRYVILVRNIQSMLISHYEKYRVEYNCEFSEYLRGDVANKRFDSDIWWCIRFQNSWGSIMEKYPDEFIVVKYEILVADALKQLQEINYFLRLGLTQEALLFGITESTKEKMRNKPQKEPGKFDNRRIAVRIGGNLGEAAFSEEDEFFFKKTCGSYLKYDFGYDYS